MKTPIMGLCLGAILFSPVFAEEATYMPPPPTMSDAEIAQAASEPLPTLPENDTVTSAATTIAATPVPQDSEQHEQVGRMKVQSIRVADKYGTIEEERIPAMREEVRYIPTGSVEGYNLIGSENAQGKARNAHDKNDEMLIPSWKLFSW